MSEQLRIERVKIDQWGRASGLARDLPDNNFVVLFGENESGKTSLATALAWSLAGPGPQQLLRRFGDDGDELAANLHGRLGTEQLEIRAKAKVPKAGATGRAKENEERFDATVGGTKRTRAQFATRLGVGDFDSYQHLYWLESLRIAEKPDLTDDLSVHVQFGGIDPYGRSEDFAEKKREALGASGHNPASGSALRLCGDRGELDEKLRQIAGAKDERSQVDDILRQKLCERDRICGQLSSLRHLDGAIDDGTLAKWKSRSQDLDAVGAPSSSDRELYDRQPNAGEAIGKLEAAEGECSQLSKMLEQADAKQPTVGRSTVAGIAAGCVVAFAVLWGLLDDWRQSGLWAAAGADVIVTALLLPRLVRIPQVRRLRGQCDQAERDRQKRLQDVHSFLPEVSDAATARSSLGSICVRVQNYGNTVSAEQAALRLLQESVEHDDVALRRATEGDLDSLPAEIIALENQLRALADEAPSADERIAELHDRAVRLKDLSNEAPDAQLQKGQLTTQIRNQIVRGLGHHLAAELLYDVAETYRKEHQPRLLREAERLTSGVADWKGVTVDWQSRGDSWQSKGGKNKDLPFWVSDSNERHPDGRLSFGARSLLFLMLRLAMVAERGEESGLRLPVILDDVLVGIDDERAKRCVAVINEFSKQHQVILLTCHKGTAELAEEAGAEVLTMPPRPASEGI
ncbi:MAG: hypothetical protein F4169_08885 [Gammaproteobacteria bacterium]|nr:hypothetical protein [Gammaproteobacteria bacterium]